MLIRKDLLNVVGRSRRDFSCVHDRVSHGLAVPIPFVGRFRITLQHVLPIVGLIRRTGIVLLECRFDTLGQFTYAAGATSCIAIAALGTLAL
jgi:hypothetical protein